MLVFLLAGERLFATQSHPLWFAFIFVWLFAVVMGSALAANKLQRSINIFLGSVLSTIGLTVPFMLMISHFTGRVVYLLDPANDPCCCSLWWSAW